jgi:hypothetical protein
VSNTAIYGKNTEFDLYGYEKSNGTKIKTEMPLVSFFWFVVMFHCRREAAEILAIHSMSEKQGGLDVVFNQQKRVLSRNFIVSR